MCMLYNISQMLCITPSQDENGKERNLGLVERASIIRIFEIFSIIVSLTRGHAG